MKRRNKSADIDAGPGYTATLAAVGRAVHAESRRPLVADHLALALAGEAGAALLAQLTNQLPEASRQTFGLAFAVRTRFVEDAVEEAIQEGVGQYVILGAGLDSFAYRRADLVGRLNIFEVDRAGAQAWKRRRLAEMGVAIPPSVGYVAIDHETDELRKGLLDAGFDPAAPAIVSAIALTQYLALPRSKESSSSSRRSPPARVLWSPTSFRRPSSPSSPSWPRPGWRGRCPRPPNEANRFSACSVRMSSTGCCSGAVSRVSIRSGRASWSRGTSPTGRTRS